MTLFEFAPELKADTVLQERLRSFPNVDIHTNARTAEVLGEDHVTGLSYEDMSSGEMKELLRWYLCTNWPCAKYKMDW